MEHQKDPFLDEKEEKTCGGKRFANLDRVSVLSLAFLLIFTAFNSADNLAAKVLREDGFAGLGFYSMAALYLVFAITGFVSKGLVRKLSGKSETLRIPMFIGGLCYFVRILFFLLPAYFKTDSRSWLTSPTSITVLIIVTAMLNGFGAGILWVAQGEYLSLCATEDTKGFYFSYFFVIFMISQIIGNLVAGFVIRLSGQPTYYWSMSGLSLVGCFVFLVLKAPRIQPSKNVSPDRIQNAETEIQQASVADKQFTIAVKETFNLLISRKMRRVIPAMIWGSLSLATFAGSFVTLMTDTMSPDLTDDEQLQQSLFAMIPLGVGQMIGGALMGQAIDRRGMKVGIIFCLCQMILAFGVMLWYVYTYQFSWLTYIVTFCWGLQDSSLNNLMFCTLGFEFKEDESNEEVSDGGQEKKVDKTTPFSVQNFVQSLFVFAFMVVQAQIKTRKESGQTIQYFIYFSACMVYAWIALGIMITFNFRARK